MSCRTLIEKGASDPGAEELRQEIGSWLNTIGAGEGLEPAEPVLLSTPLGG
jgi:hypothetical protein